MSYRYMRMLLMFDMPIDTAKERKAYRQFRRFILSEGFICINTLSIAKFY